MEPIARVNSLTLDMDRMDIQDWVFNAMQTGGGFIRTFAEAVKRADWENYLFLRPVVLLMMEKYPQYKTRSH